MSIRKNSLTRTVLFEKTQSDERKRFYNSIIKSQKDCSLNERAVEYLCKMVISEVNKRKRYVKDTMFFVELTHSALELSMKRFDHYRDDGSSQSCYRYFLTLINHDINDNLRK